MSSDQTLSLHGPKTPLQELCQECGTFCKSWEVLDWVRIHHAETKGERSWPPAQICTVAHLLTNQGQCHLCKLLLGFLRSRRIPDLHDIGDMDVYLYARVSYGWEAVCVAVRLARDIVVENYELESIYNLFPGFSLGTYDYSKGRGFLQHAFEQEGSLSQNESIQAAKSWIETCLAHHASCLDFHDKTVPHRQQRPTRVLEVTDKTIRLRCDLGGQSFDYLTLSHMWGTDHSHQLQLFRENLTSFQREVPRDKLEASKIFKDAVQVTLALGYRFIWIDSLCIVQDSPEDWKYEARQMAMVYGNAVCNLAFLFPGQGRMEPQSRESLQIWSPCVLRPPSEASPGVYTQRITGEWRKAFPALEERYPWLVQRNWPLFKRAWTFQEYLLSPRTLLIGHPSLMWHCSELFYDELLGPIAPRHDTTIENPKRGKDLCKSRYFPEGLSTIVTEATCLSTPSILSFMNDWQNVVNEYRTRDLSFSNDRIIAFAGVAHSFQKFANLTYLAGAWKELFPLCLLWYVDKKLSPFVQLEYGLPNGKIPDSFWSAEIAEELKGDAPSWSWFSVPIYRMYQLWWLFQNEVFVRSKSYLDPPIVHWDDIFWAKMISFQFGSEEQNHFPEPDAFFNFKGLQVTLDMPVLPISADWLVDIGYRMLGIDSERTSDEDADFRWEHEFSYFPDVPAGRKSPPKNAMYALVSEYQTVRVAGNRNIKRYLTGLMLIPGSLSHTWARIGIWQLKIKISQVPVYAENMAAVSQRWRKYNIISSKWNMESITLV